MAQFTCNFISYTLRRPVTISAIVPSPGFPDFWDGGVCTHEKQSKYPVLYLLHGYANDYSTWLRYTLIERYAEEHNIVVITISGENKAYVNRPNDRFFDFVHEELPEFVCANLPVSRRPEDTYIAGLSMGGYGTALHGFSSPDRFCAMGIFSGGLRRGDDPDVVDVWELAKQAAQGGKPLPKVYMADGGNDPSLQMNREYRDLLLSLGMDVTWDEIAGYNHEWSFWDLEVEKFLDWIPRTDEYAALGKRKI